MNEEVKKYIKNRSSIAGKARWNKIDKKERSEIMKRVRRGESNPQQCH